MVREKVFLHVFMFSEVPLIRLNENMMLETLATGKRILSDGFAAMSNHRNTVPCCCDILMPEATVLSA
ncbi:hypothetical protein A6M27_04200 [Acidithiobacillus thiooxidans]|uniref:Uncharacterized protein n=1 Tax=Acidithiobacillus thiooxidans TaxID=930 RepID=A0A1C2IIY2_ACITH|nr:hypothetical protein A6M23_11695 [Acidithiobacillus thiooxidans]OCX73667.1 hypothetical protein A6P07_07945 [Acidithiobacillus thiooxidans]OCX75911.1 hypothetical protein A6O24_09350 [Acidithiobacillus thiooxidans]OCX81982.1 hypothetical protein A6O26_11305 [Acidithiobacillus thiooxidans]OCX84163.1 hypothetical protein A6P08_09525 [Acidithiobacillus thiooxidans]